MNKEKAIPGYVISDILYEGNDTIIYRAINSRNKKPVIIKSLKEEAQGSLKAARLSRELETLQSIGIEGVSKLSEKPVNGAPPLLVMEDFGGISLSAFIRTTTIELHQFLVIAGKVADILSRLHAKGIMHKNISPDNIIINPSTGEIRLIDFGISAQLSHEHTGAHNPAVLEGSLPYMSPEQTGRMNRSVDYRTDLYSLGITFYQLLTGDLPFATDDAMELIHCHIAKKLPLVSTCKPGVPQVVCDIVSRLTAKIAGERYQSAVGLKLDLEHCLRSLTESGTIPYFTIGLHDVFSTFKIPENLYGREKEVARLQQSFENTALGGGGFLLINGSAGIGKTALVNEIHKPAIRKKGCFISGKFDQYNAAIPFHAFRHAFADLLKYLMGEPKEKLAQIKEALLQGLGLNASVLTGLVPEFEMIVGPQTAAHELNPAESQNRFFFTLRDFINIIATPAQPLIIFLDDLQWGDDASLRLISELMTRDMPHLFLIAACRNNELSEGHPTALMLNELRKSGKVEEVFLHVLTEENVTRLVADAVLATKEQAAPLAAIIYKRTGGNPFYLNEILKSIYREGLLNFDYAVGRWVWDIREITALNISDNAVQFMTGRLKELPPSCREILEWAACIGNHFKLSTLKKLTGHPASETATALWPALEAELVAPMSEDYRLVTEDFDFNVQYKFLHDRIRQAAYLLIPPDRLKLLNLTIGRLLLQTANKTERAEQLIELVRHYNEARSLLTDTAEIIELARLNLAAGRKAQMAVAYQSAVGYFKTGIELLGNNAWKEQYGLAFALYKGYAQNAYQTADAQTAEACIALLLHNAKTALEKVDVLSMQVRQYNTVGKAEEAIKAGVEGLRLLGYTLSEDPGALAVMKELLLAKWRLGSRKATALINLPPLRNPVIRAAARLLSDIAPSAFILGRDNLFGLAQIKIVNFSLRYGNCPESAYAYITFGTVLKEAFGDLAAAESFGRLGLGINKQLADVEYRCRVIAAYGVLTHHFNNHWNTTGDWFKKGLEAGHLSGDLFFLAYCAVNVAKWNPALTLSKSLSEQQTFLRVAQDTNYTDAVDVGIMNVQWTKAMMGLTTGLSSLNDDGFNEGLCLEQMTARKYSSGIGMYHIFKAELHLACEDYEKAYEAVRKSDEYVKSLTSLINLTRLCSAAFFACSGCLITGSALPKSELKKRMKKELHRMKKWAAHNPVNFQHLYFLMEAEWRQVTHHFTTAAASYEASIRLARENGWPADEAFANERAAKFYEFKKLKASLIYWSETIRLYKKCGASGKLSYLEKTYPEFLASATFAGAQRHGREQPEESSQGLDVDTIIKSSQAISGEIELKSLLQKMMHMMVINAGAESGLLLLEDGGRLYIQASTDGNEVATLQNIPLDETALLPRSVVNYVSNLKEAVVIDNASEEGEFTSDEYIVRQKPKSVLCSPIVFLHKLYGIIYLENNLSVGAFTQERLKTVSLLSSQMAISIQNAQLYASLEEKVQQRTVELRAEKKKSDDLLMNILPAEVAEELKQNGFAEAKQFEQATVLFTDFIDFTKISERLSAKELVAEVHRYFTAFDKIIEQTGLEKIKTIGDAYLAVAGLPQEDAYHARKAADAALQIVDFVRQQKAAGALFDIRVGLNSGPVIAGIVGAKKFAYDIWGDTVNTASRMETASEGSRINISKSTYKLLAGDYDCGYRGLINAKNKGMIDMYFLEGKKESIAQ